MKEKQEASFSDKELSEKEKEEKAKERQQARAKVDDVEGAGALLAELAKKTPEELASCSSARSASTWTLVERVRQAAEAAK